MAARRRCDLKQLRSTFRRAGSPSCSWTSCRSSIAPGDGCALTFRVTPPIDAQPTKAYFHRNDPEIDAIYKIDDPKYVTLALPPPPVSARVDLQHQWR